MWQLNVGGCIWIGGGKGKGEGKSIRDLGKKEDARVGWVKRQIHIGVFV